MRPFYHKLRNNSLLVRLLMVPVFVAVCYLYGWPELRALTVATLMQISAALGVPMQRLGADLISVAGVNAQFVVACTMIDAFFGAIPLLWRSSLSWLQNLGRLGMVAGGVFVLNIVRLEIGFVAMTWGAPWWLAHECLAGVAYFCLFVFIAREGAWEIATVSVQPVLA